MSDIVVTVPRDRWEDWLAEGDLAGDPATQSCESLQELYDFVLSGARPRIRPQERVYIVAHGKLRGYAPLVAIGEPDEIMAWRGEVTPRMFSLIRGSGAGAVACTIDEPIRGFRGWRYRWWRREDEKPFPDWRAP